METKFGKKNKQVEGKTLSGNRKNEHEICPDSETKKCDVGYNNFCRQSEKSLNQTTKDHKNIDNIKSLWKQDIAKKLN